MSVDSSPRRERLLEAVVEEVAQSGYQSTTIAQITAAARLSRTTFYEHFIDKQDCFLTAYRELAERLITIIDQVLEQSAHADGTHTVLCTLVELAKREPNVALILTRESSTAGLRALDERNRLLTSIEQTVEQARRAASRQAPTANLPARALVGAAMRELAMRLHKGEQPEGLLSGLIDWSESYTPASPTNWKPSEEGPPELATTNSRPPTGKRPVRPRLTPHERIVRAVAQLAQRNGYPQLTVAEIAAAAGVNRETFYQHFTDKESAYIAALQLVFERAIAATAGAFFGPPDWTERVWNGARALTEFLSDEPALAHIALAEPYAVGADAIELIIDQQLAFTIFLEEGYRWRPGAEHTSRLTSNLIVCAIFELLDRRLRERPEDGLAVLVPEIVYLALAPFTGANAASEFIERKLTETPVSQAI